MAGSGPAYIYQVHWFSTHFDDDYAGRGSEGTGCSCKSCNLRLSYYHKVIEALADGAVMMGLPRALATEQVSNKQTHKKITKQVNFLTSKQTHKYTIEKTMT